MCCWKNVRRKLFRRDGNLAVSPSDCQYVRIVNFGFNFIIIYCTVAIVYGIIIIIWFVATIALNKDEYNIIMYTCFVACHVSNFFSRLFHILIGYILYIIYHSVIYRWMLSEYNCWRCRRALHDSFLTCALARFYLRNKLLAYLCS